MATEKRLIDANALREAVTTDYYEHFTRYHDTDQIALIDMVCDDIDESPTVDAVEVVHGRWHNEFVKGIRGVFGEVFVCSECKTRYLIPNMNYCPNCGAKMDGDGNG